MRTSTSRALWRVSYFVLLMLGVEFLDELAYSALELARPLIRDTFGLSYVQLGLITTLPVLVAIMIEPVAGLFADTARRRHLVVGGALIFGVGLLVQGLSASFAVFLLGATLQAPASGIFVNLAQASLMDDAPQRRENRMAMWTLSGSLAVVIGPLSLGAVVALGADWRSFFIFVGLISLLVALLLLRLPANAALRSAEDAEDEEEDMPLRQRLQSALDLLRSGEIWRWLILLEFGNLMIDVLFSLLALYMIDVVGVTTAEAAVDVATWTGVGLLGDFLLIPLLERVPGVVYLRFSAALTLILFPIFLLVDAWALKLILLALLGFFNAGWYAILQGKLYDRLDEQSGAVLIVGNAAGLFGASLPLLLGLIAEQAGLEAAMWCLLLGPIVLLLGLPRYRPADEA